ncbi:MAG: phosphatase PAP2 family protein [Spongiibacteraceae bacterium]
MKIINSLFQYDLRMLLWCTHTRYQTTLAKLAKSVSKTGDGYLQILIPTSLWLLEEQQGENFFFTALLAFSIQLPIYWLLKNCLKRRRPPEVIPSFQSFIAASDQFSFPSGHSSAAFLLANLSTMFYGAIAWPLYVWASLVALSRVLLGVHFPTDILAGIALATVTTFYVLPFTI